MKYHRKSPLITSLRILQTSNDHLATDSGYLSISLQKGAGSSSPSGYNYLLSLGPVAVRAQRYVLLYVTNRSSKEVVVNSVGGGFFWGVFLHSDGEENLEVTLAPGQEAVWRGLFNPTDINGDQSIQRASMRAGDERPVDIVVDFHLLASFTKTLTNSTELLLSGFGQKFNDPPYRISLGPAPLFYHLLLSKMEVAGQEDRWCQDEYINDWLQCRKVRSDNVNVSWDFAIQGLDGGYSHRDGTVTAAATLTGLYDAIEVPPTLELVLAKSR